jgi:diguanylate cyclase (GGDEF)-like protein
MVRDSGVFMDLRTVPILLAASFVGRPAALLALAMALACRVWLGGPAAPAGEFGLVIAGLAGQIAAFFPAGSVCRRITLLVCAPMPVLAFLMLPGAAAVIAPMIHLAAFDVLGCAVLWLFLTRETRRIALEAELHRMASCDPLTGLANRRAFERLAASLAESPRARVLLLVDFDGLKAINDRHGHATGDQALSAVAHTLRKVAGPEAAVARLGGDEFVRRQPVTSVSAAHEVADRLRRSMPEIRVGGVVKRLTVSTGGAVSASGAPMSMAELISAADVALYRAKNRGRDRCEIVALHSGRSDMVTAASPAPARATR